MANLRDANIFQDFTVWIDGRGLIGQAMSFTPPNLEAKTEEYRGGGMDGSIKIPHGFNVLDFSFKLHTWDASVFSRFGYGVSSMDVPITFRGHLKTAGGTDRGVIITTRSLITGIKIGDLESGGKVDLEVSCSANYYRHVVGDEVVYDVDVINKIAFIGGVDLALSARRLLGFSY